MDIPESTNFIQDIIVDDLKTGKRDHVLTRFPPEPNGYIHIGHAKSICLNFGTAKKFCGKTNLRFDDTNPTKEDTEYVDSIYNDVHWLGFNWEEPVHYASDYYDQLYDFAEQLIQLGKAYVDDLSPEEMREYRGNDAGKPSKPSPYRDRSIEENLDLFRRMKAGEFADGAKTLRAKLDLSSPNMNMRDPAVYRIKHATHHRTGDKWCIYPMYDFAHPLSDWIEGITHSICTLEFEAHRPLYNWFLETLNLKNRPQQIEFARLNLSYTVMSKRKLLELVKKNYVDGWDDPRMPTICGLRRRGYTPESLRLFCQTIGVAKFNSVIDTVVLENSAREDLNKRALRRMGVLNPIKLVIGNYPEDQTEMLVAINNPENEADGTREVPFSKTLYIERDDFMEDAPKKYYRLTPGREVRLRYAYFVTCKNCVKDADGNVVEVHCEYDPESRGGQSPDGRRVQGTIHWVNAATALDAEVRLYDRLFSVENPDDPNNTGDYKDYLNPESLKVIEGAKLEPSLSDARLEDRFQFERIGYFTLDKNSTPEKLVFNRTVSLRDSWSKIAKK